MNDAIENLWQKRSANAHFGLVWNDPQSDRLNPATESRVSRMARWFLCVSLLVLSPVPARAQDGNPGQGHKRYIVTSEEQAARAVAAGAKIVRQTKGLKAVLCAPAVAAALGLQEDILLCAADVSANAQVGAGQLHALGLTGAGRKIVVLDTGYDYRHPEMRSSYLGGYDFVNGDADPMDDNGHGTFVAGLITADGTFYSVAQGVAPDTGIIAAKVLGANGFGYFSDILAAIYWAVDGPDGVTGTADDFLPDAISISIGSFYPFVYTNVCDDVYPWLATAIQHARARGTVVVVGASNYGRLGVTLPGCLSCSLTVGAVDGFDAWAWFSGVGTAVDVTAPGVGLVSTSPGGTYLFASGTSASTPIVSGVVALLRQACPDASVAAVESAIIKSAAPLGEPGYDPLFGWGRVHACLAIRYLTAMNSPQQLLQQLMELLNQAGPELRNTEPLVTSLRAASASLDKGSVGAAINELHAFQNKVRAQIAPTNTALADDLSEAAAQLINKLRSAENPASPGLLP